MAAARKIGPFTDSTSAVFSRFSEMWTPSWDSGLEAKQALGRIAPRQRLGRKKTPILGGKNRRR
jgi:hypothetical protein